MAARFGVEARLLPMTDDRVETRIDAVDADGGGELDLHFQEYWVRRGARRRVKGVRFAGVETARPAPGVLEAIERADVVVLPPSNPVVSIGPILAVPGIREAVRARGPVVGGERHRRRRAARRHGRQADAGRSGSRSRRPAPPQPTTELLGAWVIDERDRPRSPRSRRAACGWSSPTR